MTRQWCESQRCPCRNEERVSHVYAPLVRGGDGDFRSSRKRQVKTRSRSAARSRQPPESSRTALSFPIRPRRGSVAPPRRPWGVEARPLVSCAAGRRNLAAPRPPLPTSCFGRSNATRPVWPPRRGRLARATSRWTTCRSNAALLSANSLRRPRAPSARLSLRRRRPPSDAARPLPRPIAPLHALGPGLSGGGW